MLETDPSKNKFFDPNIKMGGGNRRNGRRQAFMFTEEGSETHKKAADRLRHKLSKKAIADRFGKVQKAAAPIVDANGNENPNLMELGTRQPVSKEVLPFKEEGAIPEMEWWDAALNPNYTDPKKPLFDQTKITLYIQH